MKQHSIQTAMIKKIAERLGPLRAKVVFLGGSATGFHITDESQHKDFKYKLTQDL
jgi:hypothetical protein